MAKERRKGHQPTTKPSKYNEKWI